MQTSNNKQPADPGDIIISAFRSFSGTASDISMQLFIDMVRGARFARHRETIMQLRQIDKKSNGKMYDQLKRSLPCVTISCRCTPGKTHAAHEEPNGVLAIDIDGDDNLQFDADDWPGIRRILGALPFVYLSALSAGGKGCFMVIAVDPDVNFGIMFKALESYFVTTFGIVVDKNCSNVNRLRFLSYDPGAVVKMPSTCFKLIAAPEPIKREPPRRAKKSASTRCSVSTVASTPESDAARASAAADIWERRGISLDDYDDWYRLAGALLGVPGGEDIFHRISRHSPKYNPENTSWKFNHSNLNRFGIGTFFELCKKYGITIEDINREYYKQIFSPL